MQLIVLDPPRYPGEGGGFNWRFLESRNRGRRLFAPGCLKLNDICAAINRRPPRFGNNVSEWNASTIEQCIATRKMAVLFDAAILPPHDQDGDGLSRGKIAFFPIVDPSYLCSGKKKKKKRTGEFFSFPQF